jgi:perosamine synthetase
MNIVTNFIVTNYMFILAITSTNEQKNMEQRSTSDLFSCITEFVKSLYPDDNPVPLHAPRFLGNEKKYLADCIDSTYVSYIGEYVGRFEEKIKVFTGARYAVAVSSGTSALHIALLLVGVAPKDEVITQSLTFVATANAIVYCGAQPIFVDVERSTLGLDPEKLENFLSSSTIQRSDGKCYNKTTGKRIAACVPMHTFGHPVKIEQVVEVCRKYSIPVVEDAAEALGSVYKDQHVGTFGTLGILSFNGNKIVTTGGGGMIITNDEKLAKKANHLTTTAKKPHPWEYYHDEIGFNFRMSNINAAIGYAQMEYFNESLENKRATAQSYEQFFKQIDIPFISEPLDCRSNYWLNAIVLKNKLARDHFLAYSSSNEIQSRPAWSLISNLSIYRHCQSINIETAEWLVERLVSIPSSVRI